MRVWGRHSPAGVVAVCVIATTAWLARETLGGWISARPAILPGFLVGTTVAVTVLALSLWIEHVALRRAWRERTSAVLRVDRIGPPSPIADWLRRLPDPLEVLTRPLLRLRPLQRVAEDWFDAGLGSKAWHPLALLSAAGLLGWMTGMRIAGPLLGLALCLSLPVVPRAWIANRGEASRRRIGEQLPSMMDVLASGLAAGLSFQQAVAYAAEELPDPVSSVLRNLDRQLKLGFSLEEGLARLLDLHPEESLGMVVEGINLQRRFGGDLVRMLSETAVRLRERVELEQEVRAVTAQGRLSGWVMAALVPVSAGLLLVSNPRYIDVLFDTWIGQSLLVFSLGLQLAGWGVISRLVRIAY
jgi:tight adherence protein B